MTSRFRSNLFWTLVLIVATIFVLHWVVEQLKALLPFLAIGSVTVATLWLFVAWWRRRQGYY